MAMITPTACDNHSHSAGSRHNEAPPREVPTLTGLLSLAGQAPGLAVPFFTGTKWRRARIARGTRREHST